MVRAGRDTRRTWGELVGVFSKRRPERSDSMGTGMLLEVDDLHVTYGRRARAVQGITFAVRAGEIVALLGPNGAGKTSTLRAISGFLRAEPGRLSRGAVVFGGRRIAGWAPHQTARLGIRMVAERDKIFAQLTVERNLRLNGQREATDADLEQAFVYFPRLRTLLPQTAGYLSGGERQMLALARAIISNARLLLIDEMSLGLSPSALSQLLETVKQIHDTKGTTTLLVEQNATAALSIASRGYALDTGRIVAAGPSEELAPRMAELYLGSSKHVSTI